MNIGRHTRLGQQGLTLLELLIAMTLSAFLLGGVIETFTSARQTYRVEEGLSRLIENGRYAIEFIDRDVRMAGFGGCKGQLAFLDDDSVNDLNHLTTSYPTKFGTTLEGFESTSASAWTPTIDGSFSAPDGDSDIITIRRAAEAGYSITSHAPPASSDITVTNTDGLTAGEDEVLIADCNNAEVFLVTATTGTTISHNNVLANNYPTGEVLPIHTISYYVKTLDGTPTLIRKVKNDTQGLIEGVESLQIEYGVDTDLNTATGNSDDYTANYYVSADAVPLADMRKVVSVRIRLLVATPDDHVTAEKAGYSFNGDVVAAADVPDHRIRREFTSTIALRNRIK